MTDAAPEATDTTTDTTKDTGSETASVDDLRAELDRWKAEARKHEDRSKENAKKARELEQLQRAAMTDAERQIAEARDAGRAEATQTLVGRLVDAEIRVAANGRTFTPDAVLSLDRNQFITDDGSVDTDAIAKWVDANSTAQVTEPEGPLSPFDLGQGRSSSPALGDDAAFARMVADKVGAPRT